MFPRPVRACRSLAGRFGIGESGGAFGPGPVRSPDFAEGPKKSGRVLVASGRNLTIGKRQGLLQLFDSDIAAGRPENGCSPDGIPIERLVARVGEVLHARS